MTRFPVGVGQADSYRIRVDPWIPTFVGMTRCAHRRPETTRHSLGGGNPVLVRSPMAALRSNTLQGQATGFTCRCKRPSFPCRWESSLFSHLSNSGLISHRVTICVHLVVKWVCTLAGDQRGSGIATQTSETGRGDARATMLSFLRSTESIEVRRRIS
jgi:hypothetical protein